MSFELAWPQRPHRVRFKKAIRVVPLVDGPPRAYRVLAGNLSKHGIFLSTPEPFPEGTKVALSLEAGGRVLPFAQGEVMWRQGSGAIAVPGKVCGGAGFGVRFTSFLHPRAHELVEYLVKHLDTGRPLALPRRRKWKKAALWASGIAASAMLAAVGVMLGKQVTVEPPTPIVAAPAPAPAEEPLLKPSTQVAEEEPELAALPPAPQLEPAERLSETVLEEEPKPEPVMAAAAPAAAKPAESMSSTGLLPLPKCAGSSLRWSQRGSHLELEVAPAAGGRFAAAFRMKNPERLVIDMNGAAPKRSHVVKAAEIPNVSTLRIGKHKNGGTRLVLDLTRPMTLQVEGTRLELSY